jgi:CHAT domain-containing protein
MPTTRDEQYIDLIQTLLACDTGEEGRILTKHADLIDAGLLAKMQAYAKHLSEEGHARAGQRLQSLAQDLQSNGPPEQKTEMSDLSEEGLRLRVQFLDEFMAIVSESEEDTSAAHVVLDHNVDVIDEATVEIFRLYVTEQIQCAAADEESYAWAALAVTVGAMLQEYPRGLRAIQMEWSRCAYEIALQVFTFEAAPQEWAGTQMNLGTAYSERIRGGRAANLEQAIAAYENALQVFTCKAAPWEWAQVQNNLGNTYSKRIRGDRAANLEQAIAAYENALDVFTREAVRQQWATTQNNLGIAYRYRIRGDRAANLEQAIAAYENALEISTREAAPREWAGTQMNLGSAYRERIRGDRAANLEQAIAAYENSLQVFTCKAAPWEWAGTQMNLGTAYSERIRGDRAANLEQAIAAYENALQVRTREAAPREWAMAQAGLGNAYQERINGDRAANLEQAIAAYENALGVWTRKAAPREWADVQNNLGPAYAERISEDRAANIERAIAAFEKALEFHRPDTDPVTALVTARNLSRLFQEQGRWTETRETLRQAVEAVEAARDEALDGDRRTEIITEAMDVYAGMVEACLQTGRVSEALAYAERSRSRTLADLLHGRDVRPSDAVPSELAEEEREVLQRIRALRQKMQAGARGGGRVGPVPGPPGDQRHGIGRTPQTPGVDRDATEREVRGAIQRRREVMKQIGDYDPAYRQSLAATPMAPEDVQRFADAQGTAIVEWYQTGERLHAFIVVPEADAPKVVTLSPDAFKHTIGVIQRYQAGYGHGWSNGRLGSELPELLEALSDALQLPEIADLIPEACRSVLLVPHRALHLVPLHAMPTGTGDALLVDRFPEGVRYAPSVLLAQLTAGQQRPELDVLWAAENPTGDLPFTELEVSDLRRHFPTASVLRREAAGKPTLQDEGDFVRSHCSHFACHGTFNASEPLRSALVLSGGDRLTLGEIFELQLQQSRLTVLSACETGLTDVTDLADEYVGLPSGFLFAGSQAVVSSLWPVSDVSTSVFMMAFYERLAEVGTGERAVTRALNETQQWMRTAGKEELEAWVDRREGLSSAQRLQLKIRLEDLAAQAPEGTPPLGDPYHWAPFRVVGD